MNDVLSELDGYDTCMNSSRFSRRTHRLACSLCSRAGKRTVQRASGLPEPAHRPTPGDRTSVGVRSAAYPAKVPFIFVPLPRTGGPKSSERSPNET